MIQIFSDARPAKSVAALLILGLALSLAPVLAMAASQQTEADAPAETKAEKQARKKAERDARVEAFILKKKAQQADKLAADEERAPPRFCRSRRRR